MHSMSQLLCTQSIQVALVSTDSAGRENLLYKAHLCPWPFFHQTAQQSYYTGFSSDVKGAAEMKVFFGTLVCWDANSIPYDPFLHPMLR